jgi:hypothetical protein
MQRIDSWETFLATEVDGLILCSGRSRYPGVGALYGALDEIATRQFEMVGLEGLNTDGVGIFPSLDHITDWSSIRGTPADRVGQAVAAARVLLERWRGEVQFVAVTVREDQSD